MILASWEAAFRLLGPALHWKPWNFPAPSGVLDAMLGMLNVQTGFSEPLHPGWPRPPEIDPHLTAPWYASPLVEADVVSILRLLIGFVASLLIGGVLGLLMWRWGGFDRFFGPLLLGLQTLPSVCWVPLGIVFLGLSEKVILFVLVMGSFSAVALALRDGLRLIPPLYPRAGLMLGARGWKLYRYVLLPASLPALSNSLRQGFSFAWRSLIGGEMLFTAVDRHGLGFLLQTGREIGGPAQVVALMIVMVVIGILADRWVFATLQRRIHARFGLS